MKKKPKVVTICAECFKSRIREYDGGQEYVCHSKKNIVRNDFKTGEARMEANRVVDADKNKGKCKDYINNNEVYARAKRIKKLRRK
jgi:hypothetical protein